MVGPEKKEMLLSDLMAMYPKGSTRAHFSMVNDLAVNKMYGVKTKNIVNYDSFGGDVFMSVDGTFGVCIALPVEDKY